MSKFDATTFKISFFVMLFADLVAWRGVGLINWKWGIGLIAAAGVVAAIIATPRPRRVDPTVGQLMLRVGVMSLAGMAVFAGVALGTAGSILFAGSAVAIVLFLLDEIGLSNSVLAANVFGLPGLLAACYICAA